MKPIHAYAATNRLIAILSALGMIAGCTIHVHVSDHQHETDIAGHTRDLTQPPAHAVTSLFSKGFNPTALHLNGPASLVGARLRLTDGSPDQNSSAFYARPVNVGRDFVTTFRFQITPNAPLPIGEGFTFVIQSDVGVTSLNIGQTDSLGLVGGLHFAIKFGTYNNTPDPGWLHAETSDNSTGLYVNRSPDFSDGETAIDVPKDKIDFHSGHTFEVSLAYTAPKGATPGNLTEKITDQDTGLSWSATYQNVDMKSNFKRADVTGEYAFAGFTASTGNPLNDGRNGYVYGKGQSTQEILSWTWNDGTVSPAFNFGASFELASSTLTAGAILDANNNIVRTLWQANVLPKGRFDAYWDGMDQVGHSLNPQHNPAPYTFEVITNPATTTKTVIASDNHNPTDPYSSLSALGLYGLAVNPDASTIWAAINGGDTAGGGFLKKMDGNGYMKATDTRWLFNYAQGSSVALDSQYAYVAAEVGGWSGDHAILKIKISNNDATVGFSDQGHTNADGSEVTKIINSNLVRVLKGQHTYWALRGIAVTNYNDPVRGSVWVTDLVTNAVHQYDKTTGDQIGTPISVPSPTGIAVDPSSGSLWVAHAASNGGAANLISVYSSAGALVRDATEISGLVDVWSLAVVNGKLYVADRGAGKALVYSLSGNGVINGLTPLVIGRPCTFGTDDGVHCFWELHAIAADEAGNIFTGQHTLSTSGASGVQVSKWSSAGANAWTRGGYEYSVTAGAADPQHPNTVYSSSLHRYTLDYASQTWKYAGNTAYPGWNTNKWLDVKNVPTTSQTSFVNIGSKRFLALNMDAKVLLYAINPDGSLHPATLISSRGLSNNHGWTWNDGAGDGIPLDNQVVDSGVDPGNLCLLQIDALGNLWYQSLTGLYSIFQIPLAGTDAAGNPMYNWNQARAMIVLPDLHLWNFAVASDGIYLALTDNELQPLTSMTVYGNYSLGGAPALYKYDPGGNFLWKIALPDYPLALAAIPGGGVMSGGQVTAKIYQILPSGQLVNVLFPYNAADWLDNTGAMSVVRNQTDGLLDVFAEGIGNGYNLWHRIDDRVPATAFRGVPTAGSFVNLAPH